MSMGEDGGGGGEGEVEIIYLDTEKVGRTYVSKERGGGGREVGREGRVGEREEGER